MHPAFYTLLAIVLAGLIDLGLYIHEHGFHRKSAIFSIGSLNFWALGDRVLIQEDEFKSGYECLNCNGKGKTTCENCEGKGERAGKRCAHCDGHGKITCSVCGGKGGLLITPDTAQRRPTSGTVYSVGHKCRTLKPGQSVLYSNFSGHVIDLDRAGQPVTLRILHESEILAGLEGHLTLTNLKGKSEIAQFTN